MSGRNITRVTLEEEARKLKDHTDWDRLRSMTDEELERAIADDPESDSSDFDWDKAVMVGPLTKKAVSIRLDQDVLDFFKAAGRGYQTRINAILRSYMNAQKSR